MDKTRKTQTSLPTCHPSRFTVIFPKTFHQSTFGKDKRKALETLAKAQMQHDAVKKGGKSLFPTVTWLTMEILVWVGKPLLLWTVCQRWPAGESPPPTGTLLCNIPDAPTSHSTAVIALGTSYSNPLAFQATSMGFFSPEN